ncbi:MAG: NAD(P)/FAD-dependent oxidoreductase, partial [Verrucomicrobiota bacterium]
MADSYDFIVLGGGSAGYAAARTAHEYGMKTAVIDGAETLGGLCILRGCMPSKTLIESSNRFRSIRRADEFGLRASETAIDGEEIINRKRELIGEFAEYRQGQLEDGRFDLIRGRASFTGEKSLEVSLREAEGTRELTFRSALVATGSVVNRLPLEGLEETGYWTSDDVLEATKIPESIIVLGGGAIALELACYFEGLGREVTVVQRSEQLLTGFDEDVARALEEAIAGRCNATVFTGTKLLLAESDTESGQKIVTFEQGEERKVVKADRILQALGRKPATGGLNLEASGVSVGKGGGITCDREQRTSVETIFAAGDVCGPYEIVHVAIEQGEIAAHNAAVHLGFTEADTRKIDYRLKLYGIFTDPQVASVGLTEKEAEDQKIPFRTASYPFHDHGKSMVMGETDGFVKMITHAETGEIIGASVVGPEASDLIHEVVVA